MPDLILTAHQLNAIDWIVDALRAGKTLVALRGLAGTGKTSLIPALREALATQQDLPTHVGAPTHRAAMILRKKGISDAETVHALALMPYFTPDYVRAAQWLGETLPQQLSDAPVPPKDDVDGLPWLVWEAVQPDLQRGRDLKRLVGRHKAKRLLGSIGISGKDYFAGFGPKHGQGVLLIDEASMVGSAMLALCQQAYRQIILIGDPGQLPPVQEEAVLHGVEGVDLTEIHRQAADSPIIQLAYRARQGERVWQSELTAGSLARGEAIRVPVSAPATDFLTAPLIVWRNVTRIQQTQAIRQALGYTKTVLEVGEPLVCRSTSQEDRALGFYNNGLYTIVAVDPAHPRRVTLRDALGEDETIIAHLEDVDGKDVDPQAIPFRFGYCLTAHTAQGGEWPTVYLSMPDLWLYAGVQLKRGRKDEVAQWTYTAMTRAKETLCLLTQHTFLAPERRPMAAPKDKDKMAPPSAPLMGMTDGEQQIFGTASPVTPPDVSPVPMIDDDIADPPVPDTLREELKHAILEEHSTLREELKHVIQDASARGPIKPPKTAQDAPGATNAPSTSFSRQERDAVLVGFLEALQPKLREALLTEIHNFGTQADSTFLALRKWVEHAGAPNEHAQYQLSEALAKVVERGIAVRHDPYTVKIQALSPGAQAFPVEITMHHASVDAVVEEVEAVLAWLGKEGYVMPPSAVAF